MTDFARITIAITVNEEKVPDTIEEWDNSGLASAMGDIRDEIEEFAHAVVSQKLAGYEPKVRLDD